MSGLTVNATLPIVMRFENICIDCKKPFAIGLHQHHKKRCDACNKIHVPKQKRTWDSNAKIVCECGRPATQKFRGEKACERCIAIEKGRAVAESKRREMAEREIVAEKAERKMWRQTWYQIDGADSWKYRLYNPDKQDDYMKGIA